MKVGDTVKVYRKPLTREDFEGEAEVVRVIAKAGVYEGRPVMRCMVHFNEDSPGVAVERAIAECDVLAGGAA